MLQTFAASVNRLEVIPKNLKSALCALISLCNSEIFFASSCKEDISDGRVFPEPQRSVASASHSQKGFRLCIKI